MSGVIRSALRGAAAGAAGTTALNSVTYLDMVVRGRPSSSTPQQTIEKLSERAGVQVPGGDEQRQNRVQGLAPLTGVGAGVGVGLLVGAVRATGWRPGPLVTMLLATAGAMVGGNGPMAALGVSNPRSWAAKDWLADVVPHLAYGAVTAGVLIGLDDDRRH